MKLPGKTVFIGLRQAEILKNEFNIPIPLSLAGRLNNGPEECDARGLSQRQLNQTEGENDLAATRLDSANVNRSGHE
jgi:hypothetical protein